MSQVDHEILLLDDELVCLQALKLVLEPHYSVTGFQDPDPATRYLAQRKPSIAILDLHLRKGDAFPVLKEWRARFPETEVLVCSGEQNVETAMECIRQGASDYIVKPFEKSDLLLIIQRTLEKQQLRKKVEKLEPLLRPRPIQYVAESGAMKDVLEKIRLLKNQPHLNVLILGESGTGKEIVARLLHQQEGNAERPFVVVNMPAIPASLMEAELFGVEKGAFTDAKTSRAGKFELADGGDIFLDEIGDLPIETQAKILRVLQEKQVERVGSGSSRRVHFRAISATNQPLSELITLGKFREDLVYRLSDLVLWLPSLREHKEDIPALVEHFVGKYTLGKDLPRISDTVMTQLCAYHWPGNIRQLESTIKRALIFNKGPEIEKVEIYDLGKLNPSVSAQGANQDFTARVADFERSLLECTLRKHGGNKHAAMEELKLPKATFYRKLQQFSVPE